MQENKNEKFTFFCEALRTNELFECGIEEDEIASLIAAMFEQTDKVFEVGEGDF